MKKLYIINTINNFMDVIYNPYGRPFAEENAEWLEVYNIMDDSLLADTRANGSVTADVISRMYSYAKAAEMSGADGVICSCTSMNQATRAIQPLLHIPMINIEEPVAQKAVETGGEIGILATLPTSVDSIAAVLKEKATETSRKVELVPTVVEGAYEALCDGDRKRHDQLVCEKLYELVEKVDCIAFAQISMSLLEHENVKVPVYKIGRSGFERIKELMLV